MRKPQVVMDTCVLLSILLNAKEAVPFQIERPPTPADLCQLDLYGEEQGI